MGGGQGKQKPYIEVLAYHARAQDDEEKPETEIKYKKIVGELRYMADCTRQELSFIVGILRTAIAKQTARQWQMMKATMR